MNAPLYNRQILRLAASIPFHGRLTSPQASQSKRSPICGSQVVVDVRLDRDNRLAELGLEAQACALGQASAAIMAAHAIGRSRTEFVMARAQLAEWLQGGRSDPPEWPDIMALEPAIPHSARHASILLPYDAVIDAMALAENAGVSGAVEQGEG